MFLGTFPRLLLIRKGFEKDLYTHDEVLDDIRRSPFSLKEAAEYFRCCRNYIYDRENSNTSPRFSSLQRVQTLFDCE